MTHDERGKWVPCPENCYHGAIGEVSHEMAVDAGEPQMEGQLYPCPTCHGEGRIRRELAGALWMLGEVGDVITNGEGDITPGSRLVLEDLAREKYGKGEE